jgi:Spy/CpxP family protein refolding chaperone
MKTRMNLKGKKLTIVLIAMLSFFSAFSQQDRDEHRPPMLPDSAQIVRRVDHLALDLSLTEQQKESILKLHLAHLKEIKSQKENHYAQREKMREEMEALKQKFEQEIDAQLTEEQKAKFNEIKKEKRPPRKEGMRK